MAPRISVEQRRARLGRRHGLAEPATGRTPAEVAWDEKRREDKVRGLDVRVVRIVQADLPRFEPVASRLHELLARPLTGPRHFRAVRTPEPGCEPAAEVA